MPPPGITTATSPSVLDQGAVWVSRPQVICFLKYLNQTQAIQTQLTLRFFRNKNIFFTKVTSYLQMIKIK